MKPYHSKLKKTYSKPIAKGPSTSNRDCEDVESSTSSPSSQNSKNKWIVDNPKQDDDREKCETVTNPESDGTNSDSESDSEKQIQSIGLENKSLSDNQDLFVIDKAVGSNFSTVLTSEKSSGSDVEKEVSGEVSDGEEEEESGDEEIEEKKEAIIKSKDIRLSSALDPGIGKIETYFNMSALGKKYKPSKGKNSKYTEKNKEVMKKSAITPDFERNSTVPTYEESWRQSKKQRKLEREKTKGKGWFGLPSLDSNSERKNDLLVLQMRKALNPKQFYKGLDMKALPKYCQFGRIVEDPTDFYSSRVPKKARKKTLVDELLADAEFRKYNKRKYAEIQESKRKATGPYKHMKRLKKKKR